MAVRERRVDSYRDHSRIRQNYYVDGSAVRKLAEEPAEERRVRRAPQQKTSVRRKTHTLAKGYVVFLGVVCVFALVLCLNYLQPKAMLTSQDETIAILENEYNRLHDDNNARYNEVINSENLEVIKDKALNELGMHYADASQIQYYMLPENSYVRQYKEVSTDP